MLIVWIREFIEVNDESNVVERNFALKTIALANAVINLFIAASSDFIERYPNWAN